MRLYYGTYGHHLSGKLYVYWGDDNLRTGEQVVAPVTGKNGKEYNTMFTIARAQNEKNAEGEVDRLAEKGIAIKTIGGRGTLSLPGNKVINAETGEKKFKTKIDWKRDSEKRYRAKFPSPATDNGAVVTKKQKTANSYLKLPGGSAPFVRPTSQRKDVFNRQTASSPRSSLLSMKKTNSDMEKQKIRIKAMSKKRKRED